MADAIGPAIRRASQTARNGMQQLDAATVDELTRIYTEAADQVRAAIEQAAMGGSKVRLDQLRGLLDKIDQVLGALASARDDVLAAAIEQAAQFGVQPFTGSGLAATGRAVAPVLGSVEAMQLVDQAVSFVQQFRHADGLALSDRLWRVDRGAKEALHGTIEQAVVQGWSADKAAQEFLMRGQALPAGLQQAQTAAELAKVLPAADYLANGESGALANTLRVMRTEVNRAHGEAYMASAGQAPGVVGFRFLLSPRHPRADICDLYASQNLHGLGPGVYPDRKSCPWPAHPNTLSFVVAVFQEEVTADDRAGQETTLQALDRLGPDLRAGILGPTKANYFDRGLIGRGMVRSRVRDVNQRLDRLVARAGDTVQADPAKAAGNLQKHKMSFADAHLVLQGPTVTWRVDRAADKEPRWKTVGMIEGRTVSVVYTLRGQSKRWISLRPANATEKRKFTEAHPGGQ